ncbi:MFS transporter [Eggerthella lenta]|uniref:MFS transporter n=1 Tax=Eggerthella lenta TaxID=84112 RepID=A0A369MJU1_EGGLN|nr:MFS transporter [Eggerthella lenta]MDB1805646.1 MFS transporter [Eggerthella lenta]RDB72517.1 MFS transporter [Eggerthella lenta]
MKKSLLALATGSFALGFAEFVMMGILPATATGLRVSVPDAGDFISAYALGVCAGTLFLVFGRRVPPKRLLLGFVALVAVGNAAAACAPSAEALVAARFVSGLPHGAFFGTATIVARELADPGREGQAVSIMVLGQTVANMVGVPGGTLLAALLSWRATFLFVAVWAVGSLLLIARFVPAVRPIPDAGLAGQFRFLKKPGPWLVIGAVLLGNTGIFCWWSYVSPWLTDIGGFPADALPALLVLAGFGMVAGSLVGGRLTDRTSPGKMAATGQAIGCAALLLIFLFSGTPATAAALMFLCAFGMFFVSSPQQLLMVKVGRGGGEMIGSACVQVAFNLGNAFGAMIGQTVLNAGASYAWPSLAGVPCSLAAVVLLAVFFTRFERRYRPSTR